MVDGRTRTGKIVNRMKGQVPRAQAPAPNMPIMGDMSLPNHSGDHSAGRVLATPTTDYEIVNKKYVDEDFVPYVGATKTVNLNDKRIQFEFGHIESQDGPGALSTMDLNADVQFNLGVGSNKVFWDGSQFSSIISTGTLGSSSKKWDKVWSVNADFSGALTGGGSGHDQFSDFVGNEHIDWTSASETLTTIGNAHIGSNTAPTQKLELTGGNIKFNSQSTGILFADSGDKILTQGAGIMVWEFKKFWDVYGDTDNNGNPNDVLFRINEGGGYPGFGSNVRLTLTKAGELNLNGNFYLKDNKKSLYGTTNTDLQISSDGTNGIIDVATALRLGNATTNYQEIDSSGKVVFVGSSGLAYGEIYAASNATATTISGTGIANKVQIVSFDTNGVSNNTSPDHTNDHITITKAGVYKCNVAMHAESVASGGASTFGFSVFKNNGATEFTNCHAHRKLSGGGGDVGSISMTGLLDLAVNDTIEVWTWNETNTDDILVEDININLIQIGG